MKISDAKHTLVVTNADLSGSRFADVSLHQAQFADVNLSEARFADINLSRSTFRDVNFSNVALEDCDVTGMTIGGVPVSDLLAAQAKKASQTHLDRSAK